MLIRQSAGPGSGNGPALPELHRRLKWLALIAIGALVVLVGRLWQLQVMRGESYYERTVSNVVKVRYPPPERWAASRPRSSSRSSSSATACPWS